MGNLFITDFFNGSRIRRVDAATKIITTVVGGGTDPCVEGGPATADCFADSIASGLTVDVLGNLFFADGQISKVHKNETRRASAELSW